MQASPSLALELRPSRWLWVGSIILHQLAGGAALLAAIPMGAKVGVSIGLILSLAWLSYRYACRSSSGFIVSIEALDGRWRLTMGNGAIQQVSLIGAYAHPLLIILNFRFESGWRRSLALLPDAATAEERRRLRAWLRIWRATQLNLDNDGW